LALERFALSGPHPAAVEEMIAFIRASKRGVAFGPRDGAMGNDDVG
jgi:hypothetical protein